MSAFLVYFFYRESLTWVLYRTYEGQQQWDGLPYAQE